MSSCTVPLGSSRQNLPFKKSGKVSKLIGKNRSYQKPNFKNFFLKVTSLSCVTIPNTITSPTLAELPRSASIVLSWNARITKKKKKPHGKNVNMFHFVFLTISPITWNLFWPSSTAAPIDGGVNSSCLCIRYKKKVSINTTLKTFNLCVLAVAANKLDQLPN